MYSRTCPDCGHEQMCSPDQTEVVCSECGADLSVTYEDLVAFVRDEDDPPENRDIVATVEARSPRNPSQDVPLKDAVRQFGGKDWRHSEMLTDREQRRMGYQG